MTIPAGITIETTNWGYEVRRDGEVIRSVGFKGHEPIEKHVPVGISAEDRKRLLRELADRVIGGLADAKTNQQRAELWLDRFLAAPCACSSDPELMQNVHTTLHD